MTGKTLLLCSALWLGIRLHAQTYPEAGVGLAFNTTDVISDFTFGADVSDARLSIKASFQTRIGTKRVLVESGTPNLVYQFQERRYLFGLEGDKRFNLTQEGEYTEVGLFVGGFIGFTAYDYRGTANPQNVGFGWEAMGGAYLSDPRYFILRLGYQYLPLKTASIQPHRIGISMCFVISDDF